AGVVPDPLRFVGTLAPPRDGPAFNRLSLPPREPAQVCSHRRASATSWPAHAPRHTCGLAAPHTFALTGERQHLLGRLTRPVKAKDGPGSFEQLLSRRIEGE